MVAMFNLLGIKFKRKKYWKNNCLYIEHVKYLWNKYTLSSVEPGEIHFPISKSSTLVTTKLSICHKHHQQKLSLSIFVTTKVNKNSMS